MGRVGIARMVKVVNNGFEPTAWVYTQSLSAFVILIWPLANEDRRKEPRSIHEI